PAAIVAEEGEIGREIQRRKIARLVGSKLGRKFERLQREDFGNRRQEMPNRQELPFRIETGNKDRAGSMSDVRYRLCRQAAKLPRELLDVLHEIVRDFDLRQRV